MEKPQFVYTTYIRTTPEKLWDAVIKPEFSGQYWGGNANVSEDWKPGSKWQHVSAADTSDVYVDGEILESDPPKRLVLSWVDPDNTADRSKVTFELEPLADMVRLTVIHGEFEADTSMITKVSLGWPMVLSSLKSWLETGVPMDISSVKTCSNA